MTDYREQMDRARTERRDTETRAMLATAQGRPLPWHEWRADGKCPLCGVTGKHSDKPKEEP